MKIETTGQKNDIDEMSLRKIGIKISYFVGLIKIGDKREQQ